MVVIIGESTHKSQWVKWEIRTFYDKKKSLPGKTNKRIRAMKLKGCHDAILPKTIKDLAIPAMNWDLNAFYHWLITKPTDKNS